ncbi:MAG TPA: Ig-like domain-containing protein, partial [Chitinophagales bacterium]|nr:Ig-like domain-containing protein [Chitinophagales bacterium]
KFSTTQAMNNFTLVEKSFTYYSCDTPDTLVILLCSSTPDFRSIGSGSTGLSSGTEMWVDSVQVTPLPNGYSLPPLARDDNTFTFQNTAKTIDVLANDTDCSANPLTVSVVTNPPHGTATVDNSQNIVYTPANGYAGKDTIVYAASNGSTSGRANVYVNVFTGGTAINNIEKYFGVNPNPANGYLNMQNLTGEMVVVDFIDLTGKKIQTINVGNGTSVIETGNLPQGVYLLRGISVNNELLFTRKIVLLH